MTRKSRDKLPIPKSDSLSEFLMTVVSSLQAQDVNYVDATVYVPQFKEHAVIRIALLSPRPNLDS